MTKYEKISRGADDHILVSDDLSARAVREGWSYAGETRRAGPGVISVVGTHDTPGPLVVAAPSERAHPAVICDWRVIPRELVEADPVLRAPPQALGGAQ